MQNENQHLKTAWGFICLFVTEHSNIYGHADICCLKRWDQSYIVSIKKYCAIYVKYFVSTIARANC